MQNLRLKIIALALILSLIPKLGLELYLHEILHQTKTSSETSTSKSSQFSIKCSCFDDAAMPVLNAALIEIQVPEKRIHLYFPQLLISYSTLSKDFLFLRGPPCA